MGMYKVNFNLQILSKFLKKFYYIIKSYCMMLTFINFPRQEVKHLVLASSWSTRKDKLSSCDMCSTSDILQIHCILADFLLTSHFQLILNFHNFFAEKFKPFNILMIDFNFQWCISLPVLCESCYANLLLTAEILKDTTS